MFGTRRVSSLALIAAFLTTVAAAQVPLKNHSLTIDAAGAMICENGAQFTATTTAASALNLPMTGQVFDQLGAMLIGTGGTYTFTAVGETTTYTVLYPVGSFSVGDFVGLSVSDTPPTINGTEGTFGNTAQVAACMLPMAPATPGWALTLLVALLLATGTWLTAKKAPGVFASTGRSRLIAILVLAALGAAATVGAASAQTINIVKNEIPSTGQDFSFTGSGGLGSFDLDDDTDLELDNTATFTSLTPGVYTVTEAPIDGWILSDISCADPTENSATDEASRTASIVLDGTETVTCTFVNTQGAILVIDKVTQPAGDPTGFAFSVDEVEGSQVGSNVLEDESEVWILTLPSGFYSATETEPAGWQLQSDDCSNEASADNLSLAVGETVTCTFVNRTTVTSNLGFTKLFSPDTIGPGSTTTLVFTITNPDGIPAGLLTFSDDLPVAITIADAPNTSSTCGGTVEAPAGGSTLSFFGGSVGGFSSCTVSVDVTSSTLGVHINTSNPLTSTDGIAGGPATPTLATDDLTVDTTLPGFSKSFAPSTVALGGRTTLTFLIDNSLNAANVLNLDFTDNLPLGMEIASPANASTTCGTASFPPTFTTLAGTTLIVLDANGNATFPALAAFSTCTVSVDVVATGSGMIQNVSGDLLAEFVAAGRANATLTVTTDPLHLTKSFTDDPVPSGGTATLEFTLTNFSRDETAAGVAFSDDLTTLAPPLAGLTFASVLFNDCGGTVTGVGGTTIGLSAGTLAPEATCTLRVSLSIPPAAVPGVYTNTTGAVTGTVGGMMVTGNTASDDLFVAPVPLLVKEFRDATTGAPDPVVNAGDDVVLRFTVTNTSTTSGATDVFVFDELTDGSGDSPPDPTSGFLPFPVTVTLPPVPNPPCGAGSSVALVSAGTDRQALELTDGSLDASDGMPGGPDECTFEVTVTIPANFPPGIYTNTTEAPTATVDGATRTGLPSSDDLTVIGAPTLSKAFIDDPVAPGGTVTLEFTLDYPPDQAAAATAIGFTDNLATVLAGLSTTGPTGPPVAEACDPDGPGGDPGTGTLAASMGGTLLTFSGGALEPGESCTFSISLDVPAGAAAGSYANTTSGVAATVDGLAAIAPAASDSLDVSNLEFTKQFLPDTAIAGETATLKFTIQNVHPTLDATITFFTDNLAADLPGLAATGGVTSDDCGGTLSGAPGSLLIYLNGGVMSGSSCTIEVPVLVPPGAADGVYTNTTSSLLADQGGAVTVDPAIADLTVESTLLELSKEFTDDPVAPGDPVTLEFTLTNLDADEAASDIAFDDDFTTIVPTIAGLTFDSVLFDDCLGTVAGTGTSTVMVSGVSLAASASCTIRVSLSVSAATDANIYTNTTGPLTGTIGGLPVKGDPASDELTVIELLLFSKAFDGPAKAGETAVLTFTLTNPGASSVVNLAFSDDLDDVLSGLVATGLPLSDVCGTGSTIAGTDFLTFTGGELPPMGGMCSFDVDVVVPPAASLGTYPNTTSVLSSNGLEVASPATADLVVEGPIDFTKTFAPDPIGPGSTTNLTFTIANLTSGALAEDVAFTDVLPAGVVIATPSSAFTDCTDGVLSAPDGGTTIGLAGARVGDGATCTVSVNVTAAAPGEYDNVSGLLSSTIGGGGPATATLTVDMDLPGFSKSFAPAIIPPGGTSVLTFLIDNSLSYTDLFQLDFTDIMPAGLVVAIPSNASTDCVATSFPSTFLSADPGTGVITLSAFGFEVFEDPVVAAGATCTVTVDVTAASDDLYENVSGELTTLPSFMRSAGFATAELDVREGFLIKSFLDDPVPPGGTVDLEFTINNPSRDFPATAITFTDDLGAVLPVAPELVAALPSIPDPPCGGASTLTIAPPNILTLTGGEVPAEGSCTFKVTLMVPIGAATGIHLNTTSMISATIDGGTVMGDPATDELRVVGFPILTKEFLDATTMAPDPVVGGDDDIKIRFTITNTSTTSAATDVEFFDELTAFLPFPIDAVLPGADPCGAGSAVTLSSCGTDCQGLQLTDGLLAAAGMAGDSCSFDVTLTLPVGLPQGTYVNTTDEITAMVDGELVGGFPATDSFDLVAAPRLTKEFLDDPVQPGGTVELEFTLEHDALAPGDAVGIEFTDDLAAVVAGLTATGLPLMDVCGPGNGMVTGTAGDTQLNFAGATLTPGEICTFSVFLSVPFTAPAGIVTNTTSSVVATVLGVETTENPAEDDLAIGGIVLGKSFVDDPVISGGIVRLEFVLSNLSPDPATGITFEDPLDPDVVVGMTVVTPMPLVDPCGPGSMLETFTAPPSPTIDLGLRLTGGSLDPVGPMEGSGVCTFGVDLMVPASTPSGDYPNRTRNLKATIGGDTELYPNAVDKLIVSTAQLLLTKEFIDDPVIPGGMVTLEFTIATTGAFEEATDLAFTDDLDAALTGLVAVPPYDTGTCGGTLTGTDLLDFSGGSLTGGECSFSVDVMVPAPLPIGTTATNVTSAISGTISTLGVTGEPATDVLQISSFEFSKSFDGPSVPGGAPQLTFTIKNLSTTDSVAGLGFTDNLDAVFPSLVATTLPMTPCGAGSTITGTSTLVFSGGNLLPNGSCTFTADLQLPAMASGGSFLNTTSDLTIAGLPVAEPAEASLHIEPAPSFTKIFEPNVITQGATSRLTFTIDNTASAVAVTAAAFTDVLPFNLLVAAMPNLANGCGGTVTAPGGGTTIALVGGAVGAGESCTISIDITGLTPQTVTNTSGDLTSSSGNSGPAIATLGVAMCLLPDIDLVLMGTPVLLPETIEACNTVTIAQHTTVFGPSGVLTVRAGLAVIIENGVGVEVGGELVIEIDPTLLGTVPPP